MAEGEEFLTKEQMGLRLLQEAAGAAEEDLQREQMVEVEVAEEEL